MDSLAEVNCGIGGEKFQVENPDLIEMGQPLIPPFGQIEHPGQVEHRLPRPPGEVLLDLERGGRSWRPCYGR